MCVVAEVLVIFFSFLLFLFFFGWRTECQRSRGQECMHGKRRAILGSGVNLGVIEGVFRVQQEWRSVLGSEPWGAWRALGMEGQGRGRAVQGGTRRDWSRKELRRRQGEQR